MKDLLNIHKGLPYLVKTILLAFQHTRTREDLQVLQHGFQSVQEGQIFDLVLSEEITLKIFPKNSDWPKDSKYTMAFIGECKEIVFAGQGIVLYEPIYFRATVNYSSLWGKIQFSEEMQHDFITGHLGL